MDDYSISSLNESKNEWCARLLNLLTPHFLSGINSVYNESVSICETNKERNKYLMTFQNFLSRIPHWNSHIIENERERIIEASECHYLEDLITCIYIIQLKMLSCMRVSHENKKIDLNIPSLDTFIHTVYINIAKKVYTNVYLFEENVEAMTKQRNNREVELIVRECIINTVRDSNPVAHLIRMFLDQSEEHDKEFVKETTITDNATEGVRTEESEAAETAEMEATEPPQDSETSGSLEAPVVKKLDVLDTFDSWEPEASHGGGGSASEAGGTGSDGDGAFNKLNDLSFPRLSEASSSGEGDESSRTIKFSNAVTEVYPDGSTQNSSMGGTNADLIDVNLDEASFDSGGGTVRLNLESGNASTVEDGDLEVIEL